MPTVHFRGESLDCNTDETVLACLERHGHRMPSLCRSGSCGVCQQRCQHSADTSDLPAAAVHGLRDTEIADGVFLPCVCEPTADVHVEDPDVTHRVKVLDKTEVAQRTLRLRLELPEGFRYRAGQHVRLTRSDGVARPYSLASVPGLDRFLEVHVEIFDRGEMSGWLAGSLRVGDEVEISTARGSGFYLDSASESSLLLIAVGTGLSPLYGLLRDALHQGHRAPIVLIHATECAHTLYNEHELHSLAARHTNLRYVPIVAAGPAPDDGEVGLPQDLWNRYVSDPAAWRIHICGKGAATKQIRKSIFLAGAKMHDLYVDAFTPTLQSYSSERSTTG